MLVSAKNNEVPEGYSKTIEHIKSLGYQVISVAFLSHPKFGWDYFLYLLRARF